MFPICRFSTIKSKKYISLLYFIINNNDSLCIIAPFDNKILAIFKSYSHDILLPESIRFEYKYRLVNETLSNNLKVSNDLSNLIKIFSSLVLSLCIKIINNKLFILFSVNLLYKISKLSSFNDMNDSQNI